MVAASISTFAAPGATAQPVRAATTASPPAKANSRSPTRSYISHTPEVQVQGLFRAFQVLGKKEFETLGHTQSEVWSVPQSRFARLVQALRVFRLKIIRLARGLNHILRRHQGPVAMSAAQEGMLEESASSRESRRRQYDEGAGTRGGRICFGVRSKQARPAGGSHAAGLRSRGSCFPSTTRSKSPFQRLKVSATEKGSTWRGSVEETGESAVLMWWKDGHLSGVVRLQGPHLHDREHGRRGPRGSRDGSTR